jgi:hypothetical protein
MENMSHLVSRQGQQSGPFALEEIVAQVREKKLDLFDYIYDESKDDWVLLMEFAPLAAKLKGNKPTKPPQVVGTGTTAHSIIEWYVLKGENRFGPFGYPDVIKMLQQKVIFPFDFIWHTGMENWKRVAEIEDFNSDKVRRLFSEKEKTDLFIARKFSRKKYDARVVIHDGTSLWRGEGFEISKGGVGLTMQNALVIPGQQLTVHFSHHDDWPAFNAVCEVVSKKFVTGKDAPIQYGLRFLSLSQEVQDEFYKKVA